MAVDEVIFEQRMTKMETKFDTWTANHDKTADEHFARMKEVLEVISLKMDGYVPRREYEECVKGLSGSISLIWKSIAGAIGMGASATVAMFMMLLGKK